MGLWLQPSVRPTSNHGIEWNEFKKERSAESRRLLDFIFREYKNYEFFKSGEIIDKAEVWLGDAHHVASCWKMASQKFCPVPNEPRRNYV